MSLLDHFHPPVSERRSWEGFHGLWAAAIVEKLNGEVLGEDFYADMQVHVGSQLEVDVAALTEAGDSASSGGVATRLRTWRPPATELVIPAFFPDDIEVQVLSTVTGATLVGAIELVSPGNKDRAEARRAFVAKCVTYLSRGIGVIVVDIVTNRLANLHNELMRFLGHSEPFAMDGAISTYAVSYRPSRTEAANQVEIWPKALVLQQPLPVLPLGLRNAGVVPVDLETTYSEALKRSRLSAD